MDKDRENNIPEEDFFDDDVSNTAEIRLMEEIAAKKAEEVPEEEDGFFDDDVSNTAEIRLMEGYDGSSPEYGGALSAEDVTEEDEEEEEEEIFELEGSDRIPQKISWLAFVLTERRRLLIEIAAAAAVLIIIVLGSLIGVRQVRAKEMKRQLQAYADIGIGAEQSAEEARAALQALARAAGTAAQEVPAEETPAETETATASGDEASENIAISLSSIQKDMKIKFYRSSSSSLASGIPFRAEVTDPSGSTAVYTDDDRDGMIYKTDLAGGIYKVRVMPFGDEDKAQAGELAALILPESTYELDVKEQITYQKVDISGEVKSASEVNIAAEDTGRHDIPVESTMTDTVEWVDPSAGQAERTDGPTSEDDNYIEVDRSLIPDPYAVNGARIEGRYRPLSRANKPGTVMQEPTGDGQEQTAEEITDEAPPDTVEAYIEISTGGIDSVTLYPGAQKQLSVTVTGSDNTAYGIISEDPDVASVSDDGTITGVSVGSTHVIISAAADTGILKYVNVIVETTVDETQPLKDADGNLLYIRDVDGSYRQAYIYDYHSAQTFYRKKTDAEMSGGESTAAEPKYTGWQTIDGQTYYYSAEGVAVKGHQVIQGLPYEFDENGVLSGSTPYLGIDVSMWNGSVNWKAVAASGIKYAIVRVGFRGSSVGALVDDSSFKTNMSGAAAAGIKVGVYFYSQAVNEIEAVEEASMVLDRIAPYSLSLPVYIDVEKSGGRGDQISASQRTANIHAFCKTIASGGYSAGLYSNTEWLEKMMDAPGLSGYHIWMAQYAASPTYTATSYEMWQYTAKGRVNGINGDVDMNISYRQY